MNDDQSSSDPYLDSQDEDEIQRLLREVGHRDEPTPEMMQVVRAAVHSEWQSMVAQRVAHKRRLTHRFTWGVAASVVVGFGALLLFRYVAVEKLDAVQVASIVKVQSTSAGNVQVRASGGETWRDVIAGEALISGSEVRTDPDTRVALVFGKGLSLRVDASTHLKMLAADQISVEHGRIYIDSPTNVVAPLLVKTAFGSVNHLGTQYQVQVSNNRLTISVREGRVAVVGGYGKAQLAANESAVYTEQGEIARTAIASQDASWIWATQAAPTFAIDNRSLASFLDWVARETGRTVAYATPQARVQAEQLILRGSVEKLSPDQALQAVLATTQFVHTDSLTTIQVALQTK
jgi:ferric-dicitrate binding protein FerR (iron transport regulator)